MTTGPDRRYDAQNILEEFAGDASFDYDFAIRMAEEIAALRLAVNSWRREAEIEAEARVDERAYSYKLRTALEMIRFSGLSQGFAGDQRDAKTALDDVHGIVTEALALKKPGEE